METGSIANWNLKAGDPYAPGDFFCSVETDKATVDFEAQDEGYVAKILRDAGPDELAIEVRPCLQLRLTTKAMNPCSHRTITFLVTAARQHGTIQVVTGAGGARGGATVVSPFSKGSLLHQQVQAAAGLVGHSAQSNQLPVRLCACN